MNVYNNRGESTLIKVMIVDDHHLVRLGICRMLSEVPGIHVVAESDSGEAALEQIRKTVPDVVLMDIKMPGIGGLETTRRALLIDPDIKVIALTMCDTAPFPTQLLRAGAAGYLTKGASAREVVAAIRKVFVGQRYVCNEVAQQLALRSFRPQDPGSPFEELSSREMQIALMVMGCNKVAGISAKLHLSPKTVNSYRYRIFEKLDISSDVELALLGVKHGLIDASTVAAPASAVG